MTKKYKNQYIIILAACCALLVSCVDLVMETPTIELKHVSLKPRSQNEMNLILTLDVQNPNRFDLTLQSVQYALYLNNQEVGFGHLEKEIIMTSSSINKIQAPVVANFKNWTECLKFIIAGEELIYKIDGSANISTIFGSKILNFSKEVKMN